MARPLRLEFPGAIYHVFSRGNRREPIYSDDRDCESFLEVLGRACDRNNLVVHAYCLMTNHYHLLVETPDGNLARGMRHVNGTYTQRFNRRHDRVGHVLQGRYKAILVQRGGYLLELIRYIVLNPVRAKLVSDPVEWQWSSYAAVIGKTHPPSWLNTEWSLGQFADDRSKAVSAYISFVAAGVNAESPLGRVRNQLYLGDETYGEQLHAHGRKTRLNEVSKSQSRTLALPLADYAHRWPERNEGMARAYFSGAYTMREIAEHFGVHYMTVSRAVRRFESN